MKTGQACLCLAVIGAEEKAEAEGEEKWEIEQTVALYVEKWDTGQKSVDIESERGDRRTNAQTNRSDLKRSDLKRQI